MAEQTFLSCRLRQLQASTRKEYEESGREQLDASKIVAAARVYAEDQAANHSSGYQSTDSAPEELPEEPCADHETDYVCAQVGDNLRSITLDDPNRPWHEEVDEEFLSAELASQSAETPTLCNGHDSAASAAPWQQHNARTVPLAIPNDVAQPNCADKALWCQAQTYQRQADSRSQQAQSARSAQSDSSNVYQLFDDSASQPNADLRQWQPSALQAAPQYTFQHRRQYDEQPAVDAQWVAQPANDPIPEQRWAHREQRNSRQQWSQSAGSQPHEQRQYAECGQPDWNQHSDGLGRSSHSYQPVSEAPVYDNAPHWLNSASTINEEQFMSVATALMNSAPHANVDEKYSARTSPVQSASYENSAQYQSNLLRIVQPGAPSESGQTYRIANYSTADMCSPYENQVLCVKSQESDSNQYYLLVDQPPSLSEVDVSKPPPPLPPMLSKQTSASQNSAPTNQYLWDWDALYAQSPEMPQSDAHQRVAQPTHVPESHTVPDRQQCVAQLPPYSQNRAYAPKSPPMYAEAPQSNVNCWETPLPPSPPQGATPDTLYPELPTFAQSTPYHDNFVIHQSSPYEAPAQCSAQSRFSPQFGSDSEQQSNPSCETTVDDFRRQMPVAESVSQSTAPTRHSNQASSPTEVRVASTAVSSPCAPESAQTTPTNQVSGVRNDGQRWANARNGDQNTNMSNGGRRDNRRGSNSRNGSQNAQTTPANQSNGSRWDAQRGSNSRNTNDSGYSTSQKQRHNNNGGRFGGNNRSTKRPSYSPEEEQRLSMSLVESYGAPLDAVLERCFSKSAMFNAPCTLRSNRCDHRPEDMFVAPLWPKQATVELAQCKDRLNSVKERLSTYDLNDWHRHTRTTNPADMVMRKLRSDVKVEFLTQAWCKFYELVDHFKLIPREARRKGELRTIHLCEAPGAFVASLNHYLRLNYPDLKWQWKANSLNPYYEGNHSSSMINDDRFMLQTIENWDFGPDSTGDIMHPGYPDHLRQVWGNGQLTHLVTADGSFDCQDKPEEQEKLVSWLHLKEALTAIRVLCQGGHFVIKMFTFFECESVCLLYLLRCLFDSVDVMKPATSKEGNSEVYVVCRSYRDDPSFQPWIRRLLQIDQETFSKFSMFPLERIPRPFMRTLEECANQFADFQIAVIERNIRLYQHQRYDEFKRHFEFVQEKLFDEYVQRYRVESIPLNQTVVRMPNRRQENGFRNSNNVLEQRERKQGSHDDQLKRSSLCIRDLVKVVAEEVAAFPQSRLSKEGTVPRVELLPQDFEIRCGKPIHTITSSQFVHGMLIRVRNELMNTLDHKQYYIAAAEMEKSVYMASNPDQYPNLVDFATCLMLMKTYNDTQRQIFGVLYDRLTTLGKNEDLTLFCFPMLTQFNISVLCILNQIFEEIVFEPPNTLFLRKRDTRNFELWMPKLQEISRTYTPDQAVVSFLPIRKITGNNNPFYSWVIEANNTQIIREINLFSSYHS